MANSSMAGICVLADCILMTKSWSPALARFLAAHTGVSVVGGLDGLLGDVTPQGGALGDAFTDLQAIELGLPV